jgi:hypothetical protein
VTAIEFLMVVPPFDEICPGRRFVHEEIYRGAVKKW